MSFPQNILHLISDLDGYGLCRQLELLVGRQIDSGRSIRVVALRRDRKTARAFQQRGVNVRQLDRRWVRDPFLAVRLVKELRSGNFDCLHVWGQAGHDYLQALERFVPQTWRLVSLPDAELPTGVVLPPKPRVSRADFLVEQALPADATLIAVAGPLLRSQQVDEAIWNFELVRTLDENVRLLIFGDGPDRHRLERFARLTSKPSAIRFLGYRSDSRELLQHADLFWHTAAASEATPQTVLEAMAAGVPVVANDTANCRRLITNGENGYLVAGNGRAIFARHTRTLMHEPDHAQQLSEAAKSVIESFSLEAMVDAYAQRYASALQENRGSTTSFA